MSYEEKYLKYKQKYLELKNKLNNINNQSEDPEIPETTQYQLTETPVNEMNGGDFYSFLGKYENNNVENVINNQVQNSFNAETENMVLTETPQGQEGGEAPFVQPEPPVHLPTTQGEMVNVNPVDSVKSIADIVVPEPTATPDVNNVLAEPTGEVVPQVATESKNIVLENENMSDVENTTDIENIFKQLGGKRKSKRTQKDIEDMEDIFGSSDDISIDDSNSSSDYSATPPVPSDTNPFEDEAATSQNEVATSLTLSSATASI